jgi:hypothetical protein
MQVGAVTTCSKSWWIRVRDRVNHNMCHYCSSVCAGCQQSFVQDGAVLQWAAPAACTLCFVRFVHISLLRGLLLLLLLLQVVQQEQLAVASGER